MTEQSLDYFLADKPGAELSHSLIAEACQTLRRNRNEYLATLGNEQIISKLTEVANLWRSPDYPLRQMALDADPEETGFPREVLAAGLDACFAAAAVVPQPVEPNVLNGERPATDRAHRAG